METTIDMAAVKASLKEAFLNYRSERPHLSVRSISKLSGVNRYFLNKLLVNEDNQNPSNLDLNQVLLLSKFISEKNSLSEAINSSNREIRDTLSKIFNFDYLLKKEISPKLTHVDLYDTNIYFVLVLASYVKGTKREFVKKILGYRGEQVLRKLLKCDIVTEKRGRIFLSEGNEFTLSVDVMKQRIPDYIKYHNFNRGLKQKNYLHVYSEGLNEEAVKKIFKVHEQADHEIQKIISDKESHGDVPFFSVAFMDRFYDSTEDLDSNN